jgi:hypothetical protein
LARGIPARLTPAEGRKFALTVGTAFLVFAGIAWWRAHPTIATVLGVLGGLFWAGGLIVPAHLAPVQRAWMGLAHAISRVTMPRKIGVVYFVVLMPIGVVMRLFGRNPIRHHAVSDSYWAPRGAHGGLKNQF